MGWVTITNLVGLPFLEAQTRSVSHFNVEKATQTQNDVPLGTPVIRHISRRVLDHSHADIAECAGPGAHPSSFTGKLRKSDLRPVRN